MRLAVHHLLRLLEAAPDAPDAPDALDVKALAAEQGFPIGPVYRGEHGHRDARAWQYRRGSISFSGGKASATTYAHHPNDRDEDEYAESPRVWEAYLRIDNPFFNDPGDPFIGVDHLLPVFGEAAVRNMLATDKAIQAAVENTSNWNEDIRPRLGYMEMSDFAREAPLESLLEIYFDVYVFFDNPKNVEALKAHGYDGAIHAGMGETMDDVEYKVFSPDQARKAQEVLKVAQGRKIRKPRQTPRKPDPLTKLTVGMVRKEIAGLRTGRFPDRPAVALWDQIKGLRPGDDLPPEAYKNYLAVNRHELRGSYVPGQLSRNDLVDIVNHRNLKRWERGQQQ